MSTRCPGCALFIPRGGAHPLSRSLVTRAYLDAASAMGSPRIGAFQGPETGRARTREPLRHSWHRARGPSGRLPARGRNRFGGKGAQDRGPPAHEAPRHTTTLVVPAAPAGAPGPLGHPPRRPPLSVPARRGVDTARNHGRGQRVSPGRTMAPQGHERLEMLRNRAPTVKKQPHGRSSSTATLGTRRPRARKGRRPRHAQSDPSPPRRPPSTPAAGRWRRRAAVHARRPTFAQLRADGEILAEGFPRRLVKGEPLGFSVLVDDHEAAVRSPGRGWRSG